MMHPSEENSQGNLNLLSRPDPVRILDLVGDIGSNLIGQIWILPIFHGDPGQIFPFLDLVVIGQGYKGAYHLLSHLLVSYPFLLAGSGKGLKNHHPVVLLRPGHRNVHGCLTQQLLRIVLGVNSHHYSEKIMVGRPEGSRVQTDDPVFYIILQGLPQKTVEEILGFYILPDSCF